MADLNAKNPAVQNQTQSDPTPYIRTYAKDVARLTGTSSTPVSQPKEAPTPGVKFDEVDLSQQQGVRADASQPEKKQDPLILSKDDILQNLTMGASVPPAKRDEILARLRAHAQTAQPAPAVAFPPPPQAAPIVTPPPVQTPPVPAATPVPVPIPAAQEIPKPPEPPKHAFPFWHAKEARPGEPAPQNLHTYKTDFADHIDKEKASTFSVLAAQSDAQDARTPAPKPATIPSKKSKLPFVVGGVLLVVLAAGTLGGLYWFATPHTPHTIPFTVPSLIFADENVELPADATSPQAAIVAVAKQPSTPGEVIVTYVTTTTNGKQGIIKAAQPGGALVKQALSGAPDILLRNITDMSTAGVINAGNNTAPFFILQTSSYERTLAGMLGWEPTMQQNLAVLYPLATTGTSTAKLITAPHFIDSIVSNHDVRILKDGNNQTVFLYGYKDKQTLLIARDEAAFTALLVRLNAATGS